MGRKVVSLPPGRFHPVPDHPAFGRSSIVPRVPHQTYDITSRAAGRIHEPRPMHTQASRLAAHSSSQPGGTPAPGSRADSTHHMLPSHGTAALSCSTRPPPPAAPPFVACGNLNAPDQISEVTKGLRRSPVHHVLACWTQPCGGACGRGSGGRGTCRAFLLWEAMTRAAASRSPARWHRASATLFALVSNLTTSICGPPAGPRRDVRAEMHRRSAGRENK